jgi:hypothetical protein
MPRRLPTSVAETPCRLQSTSFETSRSTIRAAFRATGGRPLLRPRASWARASRSDSRHTGPRGPTRRRARPCPGAASLSIERPLPRWMASTRARQSGVSAEAAARSVRAGVSGPPEPWPPPARPGHGADAQPRDGGARRGAPLPIPAEAAGAPPERATGVGAAARPPGARPPARAARRAGGPPAVLPDDSEQLDARNPSRYGKRHAGLQHARPYPPIQTAAPTRPGAPVRP